LSPFAKSVSGASAGLLADVETTLGVVLVGLFAGADDNG
jgi:hypothetical protein